MVPRPRPRNACRLSHVLGLASSAFARHYSRNRGCFLFLWVLRCFTSPRSLHITLCVQARVTGHDSCRVSPFGNPRITARLPAPRGLSQPPTSFIGSWCQGIHRAPLLTWPQRLMLASTVQFSRYGRDPGPVSVRVLAGRRRSSDAGGGPRPNGERGSGSSGAWPVPSGPNSVPRPASLRSPPFPPPKQLYWR